MWMMQKRLSELKTFFASWYFWPLQRGAAGRHLFLLLILFHVAKRTVLYQLWMRSFVLTHRIRVPHCFYSYNYEKTRSHMSRTNPLERLKSNSTCSTLEDKWRHWYVKGTSSCHVASHRTQEPLEAFLKYENTVHAFFNGEQEKESIICVRMGEKKPSDTKR